MGILNDAWEEFKRVYEQEKANRQQKTVQEENAASKRIRHEYGADGERHTMQELDDDDILNQYDFLLAIRLTGIHENGIPGVTVSMDVKEDTLLSYGQISDAVHVAIHNLEVLKNKDQ